MKEIKKLGIVLNITILAAVLLAIYFKFKGDSWWIVPMILFLILILFRLFTSIHKNTNWFMQENYSIVPLSYFLGITIILMAIFTLFGTISDIRKNIQIPYWGILLLLGLWILGFLLIYYSFKSGKEK